MYDYIFRRNNVPEKVTAWTSWFELPLFKTNIAKALLSNELLNTIEEMRKDPCPFRAYKSVHDETSKDNTNEEKCKNIVAKKETEAIESSKRSSHDDDDDDVLISFSDHEAVTSTIYIWA